MRSRISFFIVFVSLLPLLLLLLLLYHSLLAAQCQYNLVETLAQMEGVMVEADKIAVYSGDGLLICSQ